MSGCDCSDNVDLNTRNKKVSDYQFFQPILISSCASGVANTASYIRLGSNVTHYPPTDNAKFVEQQMRMEQGIGIGTSACDCNGNKLQGASNDGKFATLPGSMPYELCGIPALQ